MDRANCVAQAKELDVIIGTVTDAGNIKYDNSISRKYWFENVILSREDIAALLGYAIHVTDRPIDLFVPLQISIDNTGNEYHMAYRIQARFDEQKQLVLPVIDIRVAAGICKRLVDGHCIFTYDQELHPVSVTLNGKIILDQLWAVYSVLGSEHRSTLNHAAGFSN